MGKNDIVTVVAQKANLSGVAKGGVWGKTLNCSKVERLRLEL